MSNATAAASTGANAVAEATARPVLLERWGVGYFRKRSAVRQGEQHADAVHFLNPEERAGMRRVERGVVVRAALAGALSTALAAVAEVLALPFLGDDPDLAHWTQHATFWGVVAAATLVTSAFEIAFLYWDGLRSVHELTRVAGLDLNATGSDSALGRALVRAAIELPDPAGPVFGIDPTRELALWRRVLAAALYKAKISLTNFLVKLLVRRLLGRAAVRTLLPFVAVPVTALWNGVVCWRVLREARLRAMGPSAASELAEFVLAGYRPSIEGREGLFRAIGAVAVRKRSLHPNLLAFLFELAARVGQPEAERIDDPERFLTELRTVSVEDQARTLMALVAAAVLDGRVTRRERALLTEAAAVVGAPLDLALVERLRQALVGGEGLEAALTALFLRPKRPA